jgi:hypothetical protein
MGKARQQVGEELEEFIRILFVKLKNTFVGGLSFICNVKVPA